MYTNFQAVSRKQLFVLMQDSKEGSIVDRHCLSRNWGAEIVVTLNKQMSHAVI